MNRSPNQQTEECMNNTKNKSTLKQIYGACYTVVQRYEISLFYFQVGKAI